MKRVFVTTAVNHIDPVTLEMWAGSRYYFIDGRAVEAEEFYREMDIERKKTLPSEPEKV